MRSEVLSDLEHFFEGVQWVLSLQSIYDDLSQQAEKALQFAGYPPSRHLSESDFAAIEDECAANGPELGAKLVQIRFDDLFEDGQIIKSFEEDWTAAKSLKLRRPILFEALEAHRSSWFSVSTQVVLSQITGLLRELLEHSSSRESDIYGLKVDLGELFLRIAELKLVAPSLNVRGRGTTHPDLILSGRDCQYGTRERSMQLLVLFDHLQHYLAPSDDDADDM